MQTIFLRNKNESYLHVTKFLWAVLASGKTESGPIRKRQKFRQGQEIHDLQPTSSFIIKFEPHIYLDLPAVFTEGKHSGEVLQLPPLTPTALCYSGKTLRILAHFASTVIKDWHSLKLAGLKRYLKLSKAAVTDWVGKCLKDWLISMGSQSSREAENVLHFTRSTVSSSFVNTRWCILL